MKWSVMLCPVLKLIQAPELLYRILGLCFACVYHGSLYIQRNDCVYVFCDVCRKAVYICILPPVVSGATLVWQITSAGLVAAWSSALWYELWVITDSTAHWECYLQESPMRLLFKPSKGLMSGQQRRMSIILSRESSNLGCSSNQAALMYLWAATFNNCDMEFKYTQFTTDKIHTLTQRTLTLQKLSSSFVLLVY